MRVPIPFVLFAAVLATGCSATLPDMAASPHKWERPPLPAPPSGGFELNRPYPLLPGDSISVRVFDDDKLNAIYEIPPDGVLELWRSETGPNEPRQKVRAKGKSKMELAKEIAEIYRRVKFETAPYVQVTIQSQVPRVVFVMGAVAKEGKLTLPAATRLTLSRAIAEAGGFTENADTTRVKISRKDPTTGSEVSMSLYDLDRMIETAAWERDPPLEPNDIITVRKLGHVSLFGNISSPGRYLCRNEMTLMELFAEAGGLKPFSDLDDVRVIRNEGEAGEKHYRVDVGAIINGERTDPIVVGGDRIFIEEDWK